MKWNFIYQWPFNVGDLEGLLGDVAYLTNYLSDWLTLANLKFQGKKIVIFKHLVGAQLRLRNYIKFHAYTRATKSIK